MYVSTNDLKLQIFFSSFIIFTYNSAYELFCSLQLYSEGHFVVLNGITKFTILIFLINNVH